MEVLIIHIFKGIIGEIKIGEEKSLIVTITAIVLCQIGKKVDVINSNISLTARDQKSSEKIYEYFSTLSRVLINLDEKEHIVENSCYNMKIDRDYNTEVYNRQIVYSDNRILNMYTW